MVKRHRLGRSQVAVPKHVRLAKCREALGKAFGAEAVAKASAGTGVVLMAGSVPVYAINPPLAACLGFLSLGSGISGSLGLAEIRAQREKALAHQASIKKQIKRYLHAKKVKAR
jgi:hypothetical protein